MKLLLAAIATISFWNALYADSPKPVVTGEEGLRAFDELGAGYGKRNWPSGYYQATKNLDRHEPGVAEGAARYLLALLEQSYADESNGRTVWKPLPFWGGGYDNDARSFRKALGFDLGRSTTSSPLAVPIAVWLIRNDNLEENHAVGVKLLQRIHGPEADAAIGALIQEPTPLEDALVMAVSEAGVRHLTQFKDGVAALTKSYREKVREAALQSAQLLGVERLPAGNNLELSPGLLELVKRNSQRMFVSVPKEAKWQRISNGPQGWLLSNAQGSPYLMDYFCWQYTYFDESKLTPVPLAELVQQILDKRAKLSQKNDTFNPADELAMGALSSSGMLTGQFEPSYISMPEITVSTWCWERGDIADCKRLLEPCFDRVDDERKLETASRDYFGNRYHVEMVRSFSDSDWDHARDLAQHLSKPVFDGYLYQPRAKEIYAQLTRPQIEGPLPLPSFPYWWCLQLWLTRDEQIQYLGKCLLRFHVVQISQPGEIDYNDKFGNNFYHINPYLELQKLTLTPRDLATLAPFAKDMDYIPTYGYWRNFHPGRELHRVCWVIQKLANEVSAKYSLFTGRSGKLLERADDESIYFTDNRSGDVSDELKKWALDQPYYLDLFNWWQTPAALYITYLLIRNRPIQSVPFIGFGLLLSFVNLYASLFFAYDSPPLDLSNHLARMFLILAVVQLILAFCAPKKAEAKP